MADEPFFASRVTRLPLLDADGQTLGRVEDLVFTGARREDPPRVVGFVASVQRRRIFVAAGRVGQLSGAGLRLKGGTVDLRHFSARPGELLATHLFNRTVRDETVMDIAVSRADQESWIVSGVALGSRGALRRRTHRVADWREVRALFDTGPVADQVAALRDLAPADLAAAVESMPPARRQLLAQVMEDEELADVLEEMPERDQVRLLSGLDIERVADVVEEMEPDDAADLLAEMPVEQRSLLLSTMQPEDAAALRRLLRYDATTAGGLMTPEPVIATPGTMVAEALARIRNPEVPAALAAQVFVCEPPAATPTGRFLGAVGYQRLLREPPHVAVGDCVEEDCGFVRADLSELQVAEQLAAYNLVAVAVCDDSRHLLGAVTFDDVLDRTLPVGWRQRRRLAVRGQGMTPAERPRRG